MSPRRGFALAETDLRSFDRSVLPSARRFRDLNIETGGKEIDAVEQLDLVTRESQTEEARALPDARMADAAE